MTPLQNGVSMHHFYCWSSSTAQHVAYSHNSESNTPSNHTNTDPFVQEVVKSVKLMAESVLKMSEKNVKMLSRQQCELSEEGGA
jgi:DNA polymerase III psi subunit